MRDKFSNGYILKELALLLLASGLIFFFTKDPWPKVRGLFFGGLISMVLFKHLYLSLSRSVEMEASRARFYMTLQSLIRYSIYGITIFISAKADYLSMVATIVGILSMKYLILGNNLYSFYKDKKGGTNA